MTSELEKLPPAPDAAEAPVFSFLIAEDNQLNQEVIKAMLEALCRCEIDIVGTGREALQAWSRSSYTLILMDCQMPEMDGYQASGLIREGERATANETGTKLHTPIIAMTGYTMADAREQCLAAGMDDYVAKPLTLNQLKSVLVRWLPGYAREARHG